MDEFEPNNRNNSSYKENREYSEFGSYTGHAKRKHLGAAKQKNFSESIKNISKGLAVAAAGVIIVESAVAMTDPDVFAKDFTEAIGANTSPSSVSELVTASETHVWDDEGVVIEESTCIKEGIMRFLCKICGKTKDEPIPLAAHTEEEGEDVEPGCTEPGRTGIRVCSVCGEIISEGEEIPALGHSWGPQNTIRNASCLGTGLLRSVCIRCGLAQDTIVAALGHNWGPENVLIEPSCMEGGISETRCLRCGQTRTTETASLGGHILREEETVSAPTCTSDGLSQVVCARCGDVVEENVIPATGHTETDGDLRCDTCSALLVDVSVTGGSHSGYDLISDFRIDVTSPAVFTSDIWVSVACEDYLGAEVVQDGENVTVYLYPEADNPDQVWYFTITVFKGDPPAQEIMTKRFMIDDHLIVSEL